MHVVLLSKRRVNRPFWRLQWQALLGQTINIYQSTTYKSPELYKCMIWETFGF
jgi:hypothetical protein